MRSSGSPAVCSFGDHLVEPARGLVDLLLAAGAELGRDVEQAVLLPHLDALPVLVQRLVHRLVVILAAFFQVGAGRLHRDRHQLLEPGDVAEPERVDHSRPDTGLLEGVGETGHPRLVRQPGDRHPLNDGRLPERVRVHPLDEEHGFLDVCDQHRGLLAGDAEQHLVGEPLDHRVQVAQVGDVRPERLGLPGLVQLALRQLPVERHLHPLGDVVLLQVVRRQDREPLHQVVRRLEGEHLAVVVDVQRGAGEVQGLTGERLGRGEQFRHVGAWRLGGGWLVADPGEQVGEEVIDRVRRVDRLIHGLPGEQVLDQAVLFFAGGELAGDALGGAEAVVRLFLAVQQLLGDGGVVLGAVGLGGEDQRGELGLVFLPVAVDPAVALLDADQRPRQVVVDEVVARAVHVHALGGHVSGEEDPHRLILEAETLDDPLLLDIGEPAVHDVDLAWLR